MIQYKGYTGVFEYDEEYGFFAGHVVDVRDGIYFEGRSVDELKESLRCAVDTYLAHCAEKGREPCRPPLNKEGSSPSHHVGAGLVGGGTTAGP